MIAPVPLIINREELAWAAGFFDGEGSVHYKKQRPAPNGRTHYAALILTVAQVHKEPLNRFLHAVLGIGKVKGPYGPYQPNRQPSWQWRTNGFEESQAVVALLWKFLSNIKRKQAADALQKIAANRIVLKGAK